MAFECAQGASLATQREFEAERLREARRHFADAASALIRLAVQPPTVAVLASVLDERSPGIASVPPSVADYPPEARAFFFDFGLDESDAEQFANRVGGSPRPPGRLSAPIIEAGVRAGEFAEFLLQWTGAGSAPWRSGPLGM